LEKIKMKMPFITPSCSSGKEYSVTHYPRLVDHADMQEPSDPALCEKVLSEWFGHPVILLSSGRAGINIALKAMGFHRYRSKFQVPPFLSTCVLNAIAPFAFPVELTQKGEGMLWYHQYGFPQRNAPLHSNVIEDCAHSFFSTPNTGEREWVGDVSIFSLPKFFNIAGMAGGIIVRNVELEEKLRTIVVSAPDDTEDVRIWMRAIIASAFDSEGSPIEKLFVSSAYELLSQFIKPDSNDLAGFPTSVDEIKKIGQKRRERMEFVVDYFGKDAFPEPLLWGYERIMPFAMPCFSIVDEKLREKASHLLEEIGIHAGIYQVDVNRDYCNPEYRSCILLPCHQNAPLNKLEEACEIIASFGDKR
jgi:hypothetical protein